MRFAIAIGILAQGLVAAKEPTSAELVSKGTTPRSSTRTLGRRNVLSKVKQRRNLKQNNVVENVKSKMHPLQNGRKCDPNVGSDPATDADVGILNSQCLAGESCSEFGFCVAGALGVELRQTVSPTNTEDYPTNYFDYFCGERDGDQPTDDNFNPYFTYDCTCAQISDELSTITCVDPEPTCEGNVCYDSNFVFGFDSNFTKISYTTYCATFLPPSEGEICYYYLYDSEVCRITIDDETCNSCEVIEKYEYSPQPGFTTVCYGASVFDCTNIEGGNAGNDCVGDRVSDIFGNSTLVPVEENVPFLRSILYGISSMSIDEQIEWATLTAEYIVSYYQTQNTDLLQDITALIDVLAVIPNDDRRGRSLQECGGSVTVIYDTYLSYSIEDPTLISPSEVAQMPFATEADQAIYVQYLMLFGTGDLTCIDGVDPLGQGRPLRPGKGGKSDKKSKKSSKKSSKSSKSGKKSGGKGSQIYHPPPVEHWDDDDYYKESNGKGVSAHMYGYPQQQSNNKSEKKGKSRRR